VSFIVRSRSRQKYAKKGFRTYLRIWVDKPEDATVFLSKAGIKNSFAQYKKVPTGTGLWDYKYVKTKDLDPDLEILAVVITPKGP
jgi:hypothetical protein